MRLIDADNLLAKLHNTTFGEDARPTVYRAITEEETVDAVPVIRCKDCEHYGMEYGMDVCGLGGFSPEPDDFCSRGERRER